MLVSLVHRGSAEHGRRRAEDLPDRPSLPQLVAAAPWLRAELQQRGRASALAIAAVAAIAFPAWGGFDAVLEPAHAGTFTLVRLCSVLPMLVVLGLLWRHPAGLRHPQLLTTAVLGVAQVAIAWMIPQVTDVQPYVLGLSLALYGSGCLLAGPPRWTVVLVALTWAALAGAVVLAEQPVPPAELAMAAFYLATASLIATVSHALRHSLAVRELRARVGLEREQQRAQALLTRLERLSLEDPLTGVANRRHWDTQLAAVCEEARRGGTTAAVVLLDVDLFKGINDRHGHAGGDEALRQVAGLLRRSVRDGDLVARLGGDELAVLLPGSDLARAIAVAESVRLQARELQPVGFAPGELSLSLGVALARGDQAYPVDLMSQADTELYRAKNTRNAVGAPPTAAEPAAPVPPLPVAVPR